MNTVVNPEASAQVLRNAGIPVKTYVLKRDEAGALVQPYERTVEQATGEAALEWRYIRISNAVLALVESPEPTGWGSLAGWEKELEEKPFLAIPKTLALCWGMHVSTVVGLLAPDTQQAAEVLVDGEIEGYSLAIGNAFLIAQGVDPQRVGEHLAAEIRTLATQREAIAGEVDKDTEKTEKQRVAFVAKQSQPSDSVAAEPTPITPPVSRETEESPTSSPQPEPGFAPDTTSVLSGT